MTYARFCKYAGCSQLATELSLCATHSHREKAWAKPPEKAPPAVRPSDIGIAVKVDPNFTYHQNSSSDALQRFGTYVSQAQSEAVARQNALAAQLAQNAQSRRPIPMGDLYKAIEPVISEAWGLCYGPKKP